jgi:hypothetical protein
MSAARGWPLMRTAGFWTVPIVQEKEDSMRSIRVCNAEVRVPFEVELYYSS